MTQTRTILDELVEFAIGNDRRRCFKDWGADLVAKYLIFHLRQKTCTYVRRQELRPVSAEMKREIVGLGVGWQMNEADTLRPDFVQKPFIWQETNPRGDSFLFCDLIAIEPAAVPPMAGEFQWRWPNWRMLKLFAVRRDKLVRYNAEKLLNRMEGL